MRVLVIVLALAGGAWWLLSGPSNEPLKTAELPTLGLDAYRHAPRGASHPCQGARRCLVVYIAPWCSACKRSMPLMNRLEERLADHPDAGMVAVMGTLGRSWEGRDRMANRIDMPLYLDTDGAFWDNSDGDLTGTPAWIAYDGAGDVIGTMNGGYPRDGRKYQDETLARVGLGDLT